MDEAVHRTQSPSGCVKRNLGEWCIYPVHLEGISSLTLRALPCGCLAWMHKVARGAVQFQNHVLILSGRFGGFAFRTEITGNGGFVARQRAIQTPPSAAQAAT
jgi:hypothetical protein